MKKRGQLTIFIILGVIIVGGIVLFFVLRGGVSGEGGYGKKGNVDGFVEDCLDEAIADAIVFNSLQGGYFLSPLNSSVEFDNLLIPFYWDVGVDKTPSVSDLEKQLGIGIEISLDNCVGGFEDFVEAGYGVDSGVIEGVDVKIQGKNIDAEVNFPVVLTKGGVVTEFDSFSGSYEFDYLGKYNIVREAIELQKTTPNDIPIIQYSELAFDYDFTFEIIEMGDDSVVYVFSFDEEIVPEEKYLYTFGARYNWKDVD